MPQDRLRPSLFVEAEQLCPRDQQPGNASGSPWAVWQAESAAHLRHPILDGGEIACVTLDAHLGQQPRRTVAPCLPASPQMRPLGIERCGGRSPTTSLRKPPERPHLAKVGTQRPPWRLISPATSRLDLTATTRREEPVAWPFGLSHVWGSAPPAVGIDRGSRRLRLSLPKGSVVLHTAPFSSPTETIFRWMSYRLSRGTGRSSLGGSEVTPRSRPCQRLQPTSGEREGRCAER